MIQQFLFQVVYNDSLDVVHLYCVNAQEYKFAAGYLRQLITTFLAKTANRVFWLSYLGLDLEGQLENDGSETYIKYLGIKGKPERVSEILP